MSRRPARRRAIRLPAALAMAAALLGAPGASAAERDGNALLQQCTATIGAIVNFCFGYIDAIADALVRNDEVAGFAVCLPTEWDDPQLRDIVVAFLERNYALRRLPAPELVARALSEAFPCR